MGVGEQFELEKTGRIDPEQTDDAEQADALDANPCVHDWEHHPLGGTVKTADELLIELDQNLKCVHLDMGGNHKYMVTHKTQPVLREIKEYVMQISQQPDSTDPNTVRCSVCGDGMSTVCRECTKLMVGSDG